MVKTFRFYCAVKVEAPGTDWDGHYVEAPDLISPAVTCDTPTQAIQHPDTVAFCEANNCTVYRQVK